MILNTYLFHTFSNNGGYIDEQAMSIYGSAFPLFVHVTKCSTSVRICHRYCAFTTVTSALVRLTVPAEQFTHSFTAKGAVHFRQQFARQSTTSGPIKESDGKNQMEEDEEDWNMLSGKRRVATFPNFLSLMRIAVSPVLGYLVVNEHFWPACILFTLAGLTDLLDGLIARHFPAQRSLLGSILDPVADKLLISTLFVTLAYVQLISVPVAFIVLVRDMLLVIGGFVLRYKLLDPPVTVRRFFDTSVSSVRVQPTMLSKFNTGIQLTLVSMSLASPIFDFVAHPALTFLQILTLSTTICSGLQYAFRSGMLRVKTRTKE